MLKTGIFD